MDVNELLSKWNLQHLYDKFKEENITINTLKILQPHHIKKIFSTLRTGDQAHFEFELQNWKKNFGYERDFNMETNNAKAGIKRSLLSVSDILSSTKSGTEILKYYDKHQILQEEHRTLLISTITQYLDLNGCEVSLSECAELEKQICTIFPTEELSFYTNGKRGKIYNKLANLKRSSKELFKEQKSSEEGNFECEATENYVVLVQTLRSDKITADDFDLTSF
ncbi:uncharacterized protein LOC119604245 [Lucilia sericata]|uniref:uncharacterized protein LOC119604245 n=1 Tax=Lucilia sericata TaxID=13632 RepID=UPI0018A88075|nr:uncharacterized protein LOC119604245 [Lucilia sericata]XP_037812661.1 uncharacterized protein LOC119604245 [Lucilia sericata]XP_037812663.1 uncharacterized protein LOC119604245 [Lucilia sericata]XP_037812664.1 uncharacterized protein LOC119604245 [Lucilia sericata]